LAGAKVAKGQVLKMKIEVTKFGQSFELEKPPISQSFFLIKRVSLKTIF